MTEYNILIHTPRKAYERHWNFLPRSGDFLELNLKEPYKNRRSIVIKVKRYQFVESSETHFLWGKEIF